jgi:hypothetical protein
VSRSEVSMSSASSAMSMAWLAYRGRTLPVALYQRLDDGAAAGRVQRQLRQLGVGCRQVDVS